jgi:hypothetical protein
LWLAAASLRGDVDQIISKTEASEHHTGYKYYKNPGLQAYELLRYSTMATLKINRRNRSRVRVQFTVFGYEVQVYGQTVFRSSTQDEAEKVARDLCRALG